MPGLCTQRYETISFRDNFSDSKEHLSLISSRQKEKDIKFTLPNANKLFIAYYYPKVEHAYPFEKNFVDEGQTPENTRLLIVSHNEGYRVFLCLNHHNIESYFTPCKGELLLRVRQSFRESEVGAFGQAALVSYYSRDLSKALEKTFKAAMRVTDEAGRTLYDKPQVPFWLYKIGWETGNLHKNRVTHRSIVNCVKSWKEQGVQIDYVCLGKQWQNLSADTNHNLTVLKGFGADISRFPQDLKGLIDELKKLGVQHVGVFHDALGASGGLEPSMARRNKIKKHPSGKYYLGDDMGAAFSFYFKFYRFLKKQGVSFVQVGYQSTHLAQTDKLSVNVVNKHLEIAIQAASAIQFNSTHFVIDGLRNENLFYWGISKVAKTAASYKAKKKDNLKDLISYHLKQCLWLRHLAFPYFGAVNIEAEAVETLAIFFALSGSMLTLSRAPEKRWLKYLKKMVLPSGKILTADKVLQPVGKSVFSLNGVRDPFFMAINKVQGVSLLAVFNFSDAKGRTVGLVSAKDAQLDSEQDYAVFSYKKGFLGKKKGDERFALKLAQLEADILHFMPIKDQIAVIGCHKFFLPLAPIKEVNIEEELLHISSTVDSPLLVYCEKEVLEVHRNGRLCEWDYDSSCQLLTISGGRKCSEEDIFYTINIEN
ncbi:MAG: hypothetical protein GWP59_07240 [Chlamydiales bacterium]|nr:hypothetical protein [Chlamydiales bacterium]NCF71478.1 hypothetical protein [Chlamydiales bacterium]